ncbi:guanylate cyclase domain-containing protein, partial [Haematococcus lacustris]
VLLDELTFASVKDRLVELGAVDANGLNIAKINNSMHTTPWWWLWWMCGRKPKVHSETSAVVLDITSGCPCPT